MGNSMFNSNSMRNSGGGGGSNINVIDNLNSTSGTDALSARQGGILAEQDRLLSEKVDQNKAEIELKLQQQSSKIASETELGNVKIDNKTIKITPDGTIYAETTSQNSIFEIHELILPTTQIGQSEWIIPNEYYTSGDTVIVSHNSTVLDSTMYTLSESGGVVKVTIQNTTDLPIDKNSVYLVIFHNKIPDPQFTIYNKTLLTDTVSQKTWTIDTPNFDSTKDSVLVIYNTTLLSNDEYSIVDDKLTLLVETNEQIDKNTVSVFVFSNSRPLGGNYTLPIATTGTLGGIKPDGVTITVDENTGVATVIGGGGGSISLPISANDVTETPQKQFIEAGLKSQITSNASTLNSQEMRLTTVENTLATVTTSDEKVKLNALGVAGYLEDFIDNSTISEYNGKLSAVSLQGLTATISEINALQGVSGNIQSQIDSLTSIGNFSTTIMSYSELSGVINPQPQDMVIVITDETHFGKSTIYIYNGSQWVYSGEFKGGEIRDFTTNPINLSTETSGVLEKTKYEKQNATETPITDSNNLFTATNVEEALVELFRYANSIKTGVATSIGYPLTPSDSVAVLLEKINQLKSDFSKNNTEKGVLTYSYEPLSQMIEKILSIPNISLSGTVSKKSKINITAPYKLEITLNDALSISDITTTLIEFVYGATGVTHYNLDFNNGDSSNFNPNPNLVFDGVVKIRDFYQEQLIKKEDWSEDGEVYEYEFNKLDWLTLTSIDIS